MWLFFLGGVMRNGMAVLGLVFLALLSVGCSLLPTYDKPSNIARYLTAHPERPPEVLATMEKGEVILGMTIDEVRLSYGVPKDRAVENKGISRVETWYYSQPSQVAYGSDLWNINIPTARAVFVDGVLKQWVVFGPESAEGVLSSAGVTSAEKHAASVAPQRETVPVTPMLKGQLPPQLRRAKSSLEGWPVIILSGVLKKGGDSLALLNGEVYGVGEQVEGADILYVGAEGVLLKFKSDMHFVEPGDSTRKSSKPQDEAVAP